MENKRESWRVAREMVKETIAKLEEVKATAIQDRENNYDKIDAECYYDGKVQAYAYAEILLDELLARVTQI